MSIQILNNSLLKLITRQGTDSERKNVVLNSGELGFTTDTQRLFVGNGADYGGKLVGNKFLGSNPNITIFAPGEIGDIAFNSDTRILYRIKSNNGSSITDWEDIGGEGINSSTVLANGGTKITNIVTATKTLWSTLSATTDPNTFYIVTNNNYIVI